MKQLRFVIVVAALGLASVACTYDFDRFEPQPDAAAGDAGLPDAADAHD